MEEPTSGYPKGYGMGIIEVTPLAQSEFNSNPEFFLKNPDGTWKYDVIVNGFWDINGLSDFTQEGIDLIREYIQAGKGYLFGHDTILGQYPYLERKTNLLRDLVNLKFFSDLNLSDSGAVGGAQGINVQLMKKGLLTNYPHKIGEINTNLTIPTTHTPTDEKRIVNQLSS